MLICFLRLFEHVYPHFTHSIKLILGNMYSNIFYVNWFVCFFKKVDAIVFRGSSCERISKIVKTVKMQKSMHENHI